MGNKHSKKAAKTSAACNDVFCKYSPAGVLAASRRLGMQGHSQRRQKHRSPLPQSKAQPRGQARQPPESRRRNPTQAASATHVYGNVGPSSQSHLSRGMVRAPSIIPRSTKENEYDVVQFAETKPSPSSPPAPEAVEPSVSPETTSLEESDETFYSATSDEVSNSGETTAVRQSPPNLVEAETGKSSAEVGPLNQGATPQISVNSDEGHDPLSLPWPLPGSDNSKDSMEDLHLGSIESSQTDGGGLSTMVPPSPGCRYVCPHCGEPSTPDEEADDEEANSPPPETSSSEKRLSAGDTLASLTSMEEGRERSLSSFAYTNSSFTDFSSSDSSRFFSDSSDSSDSSDELADIFVPASSSPSPAASSAYPAKTSSTVPHSISSVSRPADNPAFSTSSYPLDKPSNQPALSSDYPVYTSSAYYDAMYPPEPFSAFPAETSYPVHPLTTYTAPVYPYVNPAKAMTDGKISSSRRAGIPSASAAFTASSSSSSSSSSALVSVSMQNTPDSGLSYSSEACPYSEHSASEVSGGKDVGVMGSRSQPPGNPDVRRLQKESPPRGCSPPLLCQDSIDGFRISPKSSSQRPAAVSSSPAAASLSTIPGAQRLERRCGVADEPLSRQSSLWRDSGCFSAAELQSRLESLSSKDDDYVDAYDNRYDEEASIGLNPPAGRKVDQKFSERRRKSTPRLGVISLASLGKPWYSREANEAYNKWKCLKVIGKEEPETAEERARCDSFVPCVYWSDQPPTSSSLSAPQPPQPQQTDSWGGRHVRQRASSPSPSTPPSSPSKQPPMMSRPQRKLQPQKVRSPIPFPHNTGPMGLTFLGAYPKCSKAQTAKAKVPEDSARSDSSSPCSGVSLPSPPNSNDATPASNARKGRLDSSWEYEDEGCCHFF